MEDRLEIWLELLAGKLDRLIELGENVERASRSQGMPEEWGEHEEDHFAGAGKMVSEGPDNLRISIARELEGYRLVNDSDIGKVVEVQNSTADPWRECTLLAIDWDRPFGFFCGHVGFYRPMQWRFARIKIEEPEKEPPKKWRILEPEEVVQEGDWVNAIANKLDEDPPGGGWIPARASVIGGEASQAMGLYVARPVADEPAKEPEHPAGPMPGPGEGGCEPTEKGIGGDIEVIATARWIDGGRDRLTPADEPAKEAEHPAGPMPDPGEWYREPTEEDIGGDIEVRDSFMDPWQVGTLTKILSDGIGRFRCSHDRSGAVSWNWQFARIKIEPPEPAWEPKVGDWVRVTRPVDWIEWEHPRWEGAMNQFDEKIGKIECEWGDCFQICGFAAPNGFRYQFHRDWLSPAEPPPKEKPPEPEYREPVLPDDLGKWAEFSQDGRVWYRWNLSGCYRGAGDNEISWVAENAASIGFRHCRIKKES